MENKALNNRLIIISIFVFLFFSALTLKLVNVQIINKDKYKKSLDDIKVDEVYSTSTPRGRIFDRNYNLLVDNVLEEKEINLISHPRPFGAVHKKGFISRHI